MFIMGLRAKFAFFVDRGRGEGIRLMLEFSEIPYTETAFTKDTWPAHKRVGTESKLYTFGQGDDFY